MSGISLERCSSADYVRSKETRISEDEMRMENIYTGMFRVASKGLEAVCGPVKLNNIAKRPSGVYVVEMCLIDEDYQVVDKAPGQVSGGIWTPASPKAFELLNERRQLIGRVTEGYITNLDDGIDMSALLDQELMSA